MVVDGVLFDETLGNLVDNAAVHAPPPAPVRLSASRRPDGWVELVFEDGGPGVPVRTTSASSNASTAAGRARELPRASGSG